MHNERQLIICQLFDEISFLRYHMHSANKSSAYIPLDHLYSAGIIWRKEDNPVASRWHLPLQLMQMAQIADIL